MDVAVYFGLNVGINNSLYAGIDTDLINEDVGIFTSLSVGVDIGLGTGTMVAGCWHRRWSNLLGYIL